MKARISISVKAAVLALVAAALPFMQPVPVLAQERQPLKVQEGSSIYQRILTRPQATMTAEPGGAVVETFPPFEMFYIYGEAMAGDETFLEVGRTIGNGPEGWLPKERTIAWRHAVVLGFNNPANRERALLFRSRESMSEVLGGEDVVARLAQLRADAAAGGLDANGPVVAIEPENFVDIESNFYVLPILESFDGQIPSRQPTKLLRVASLSQNEPVDKQPRTREELLRDYKVGLVFVIDTTRSMGPYIAEVRNAVSALNDRLASHEEAERFRFGLVGFRDSIELVPELEYVTRTYLPLDEDASADRFLAAIDDMEVSTANSSGFNEDAIAGVSAALDDMDWTPFGGRYIILITDAGPRDPGPDAAKKMLAVPQLQAQIMAKHAVVYTMHLKTPAGSFDHGAAEAAYNQLSRHDNGVAYFDIADGDAAAFREQVGRLASQLTAQLTDAMNGFLADAQQAEHGTIEHETQLIGRAMQLAYLGRAAGTRAPEVFEGWMTDRDPIDRYDRPVSPYILMSRNELSTLYDIMGETVALGREDSNPDDFITRLRGVAAVASHSPDHVQNATNLGDVLGEYLHELPYRSSALNITDLDWRDMEATEEQAILDAMESKMEVMASMHADASRWWPPAPDAPDGEYLTIVPLSLMP